MVIIWRHYKNDSLQKWNIQEKLQNLKGESITCHSSLYTNAGIFITASTSKSKLVTWFRSNENGQTNFITHEELHLSHLLLHHYLHRPRHHQQHLFH